MRLRKVEAHARMFNFRILLLGLIPPALATLTLILGMNYSLWLGSSTTRMLITAIVYSLLGFIIGSYMVMRLLPKIVETYNPKTELLRRGK